MIATSFALVAFATAAVIGLYVGNGLFTSVWRALIIMIACYLIGSAIGRVAQWAVDDHIRRYQEANPIPEDAQEQADSSSASPRAAA